jgi:hypothetical protein
MDDFTDHLRRVCPTMMSLDLPRVRFYPTKPGQRCAQILFDRCRSQARSSIFGKNDERQVQFSLAIKHEVGVPMRSVWSGTAKYGDITTFLLFFHHPLPVALEKQRTSPVFPRNEATC